MSQEDNLNYIVHVPYNESVPTGGDSLTQNLNVHYEVSGHGPQPRGKSQLTGRLQSGDIAWMIAATALVLLMIPGVGYDCN